MVAKAEVVNRVLEIFYGSKQCTAFTVESEITKRQYVVTVKHLFEDEKKGSFPDSATVFLRINGEEKKFNVDIKYPKDQDIDIAVLRPKAVGDITQRFPNKNSSEGVALGQDVYFMGFPCDFGEYLLPFPFSKQPVPFVKKACMSAVLTDQYTFVLDGMNNLGFSGAPVCFQPTNPNEKTMNILGVVVNYRAEKSIVFKEKKKKGNLIKKKETKQYVYQNTGIICVHDIQFAMEIADNWE